jgi:hypothetical protein
MMIETEWGVIHARDCDDSFVVTLTAKTFPQINKPAETSVVRLRKTECPAIDQAVQVALRRSKKIRVWHSGARLLADVKARYSLDERREFFAQLNHQINSEFGRGWLFKNEDAQKIVRRIIFRT